jgi:peptidoglycan-associated lipoprotein
MTFFDFDRAAIRRDAQGILDAKLRLLRADSTIRLRIQGFADERGSWEYNLLLGLERAKVIRLFFAAGGVDPARIEVRSLGESSPRDPRHNREAWARNRRAEFLILPGQSSGE